MPTYTTNLDETVGTLYVLERDARVWTSSPAPGDHWLVLNKDEHGTVVGVQLCLALDLSLERWLAHPAREVLPEPLQAAIDGWYQQKPLDQRALVDDPERWSELIASAQVLAPGELPDW